MRAKYIRHLIIYLIVVSTLSACTPKAFFPDEGAWYCEELKMQLAFDVAGECFVMKNGEKMKCACEIDRGSDWLSVGCQEIDCEYCYLGEEIFISQFVRLDATRLVVKEKSSGKEYVFVRVS